MVVALAVVVVAAVVAVEVRVAAALVVVAAAASVAAAVGLRVVVVASVADASAFLVFLRHPDCRNLYHSPRRSMHYLHRGNLRLAMAWLMTKQESACPYLHDKE